MTLSHEQGGTGDEFDPVRWHTARLQPRGDHRPPARCQAIRRGPINRAGVVVARDV